MRQMRLAWDSARREHLRALRLRALVGLPSGWDRTHPAYVRYGLGPILSLSRDTLWLLRSQDRWD